MTSINAGTSDDAAVASPAAIPARRPDWRPLIVAVVGIIGVLAVSMTAFVVLSGAADSTTGRSQDMVAIASASFTAIGAVTSAYFGIRAANRAREDTQDARDGDIVRTAALASAEPSAIPEAMRAATIEIGKLKAGVVQ